MSSTYASGVVLNTRDLIARLHGQEKVVSFTQWSPNYKVIAILISALEQVLLYTWRCGLFRGQRIAFTD